MLEDNRGNMSQGFREELWASSENFFQKVMIGYLADSEKPHEAATNSSPRETAEQDFSIRKDLCF